MVDVQIGAELFISEKDEDKLIKHIRDRLEFASGDHRDSFVDRLEHIDRELSGYIKLDAEDRKRERDNKLGFSPKSTDINMQMVDSHLDGELTYLLSVLAPDEGIYNAIAGKEDQPIGNAFAATLNDHARIFGHYHHMVKSISDMLRYNFGGHVIQWERIIGQQLQNATDRQTVTIKNNEVVAMGNAIDSIDPYNFLWDIAAHPTRLAADGEFFATIELVRPFTLKRWDNNKHVFETKRFTGDNRTHSDVTYYRQKPDVYIEPTSEFGRINDWSGFLSAGSTAEISDHHEIVTYYGWISPSEFGIEIESDPDADKDQMQIWRFIVANAKHVIRAVPLTNAHGQLPVSIGMPKVDNLGLQSKSLAEGLLPFQRFASHEFNVHQRAARKGLYGLTFYDPRQVPLGEMRKEDLESAKIPVKLAGADRDIRKAVMQMTDVPQTDKTVGNVAAAFEFMDRMLPTNITSNLASMERATQYEVANVVHGTNRRSLKIAKTIDTQCYVGLRFQLMYNTMQFQESIELIDPNTGDKIQVNPAEFRETKIEFSLSDGLKGIDRLMIIEGMKEVIGMILQSNAANNKFDIVAIVNYWTSLMGENIDFTQFEITDILDTLQPEERQIAVQLFEQFIAAQQEQQQGAPTNGAGGDSLQLNLGAGNV